jgi:nicotinamide-nucleotide amidase
LPTDRARALAEKVLAACRQRGWTLATAESCTGGMVAAALTSIAGASDVFERGFVTYTDRAKSELLGIDAALIKEHGAVSAETAAAMAAGALAKAPVDLAVSITGIAGPSGGSAEKPVGLVYFGLAVRGGAVVTEKKILGGDRDGIRYAATLRALELLLTAATE